MAIVKGPLFSLEASGALGGAICFETNGSTQYVKALRFLTLHASSAQTIVRNRLLNASAMFFDLEDSEQVLWKNYTDSLGLTGYMAFMNQMLRRYYLNVWQFQLPPNLGWCITGDYLVNEFTVGGGFINIPGS